MAFKVFLDANIILDFTLKRESYPTAKKLIELILVGKISAFVSPSIIQIAGYWLTKAYGLPKSKQLLKALIQDVKVIDICHEYVELALHSTIDDAEDAIQYYTALFHKLDFFVSNDRKFKKQSFSSLPILNYSELIKMIEG